MAQRCTADPGPRLLCKETGVPGLQRIIPLRCMLRCARDTQRADSVMTPDFLKTKDCWAGLLLIGIGTAAMVAARNYPFGTALRMGPGYFPMILGALLILFGLSMLASALRGGERVAGSWSARALIALPLALVLFGAL